MNKETKELLNMMEEYYSTPAFLIDKDKAANMVMETYGEKREQILKELEADKEPSKEDMVDYPISLELKTVDNGDKFLYSIMNAGGKRVGLKVVITRDACTWDTLKLNVIKSLDALEKYKKDWLKEDRKADEEHE